jgi:hypothetical protein
VNKNTGILGGMFLAMFVLKLVGVIDWSWWVVTLPVWLPLSIVVLVLVIGALVVLLREIRGGGQ